MLNMAVFAPMANARIATVAAVNADAFRSTRTVYRRF
jgi:hypothetical protein